MKINYICQICGKECADANGLASHINRSKLHRNITVEEYKNKYLRESTDVCLECGKPIYISCGGRSLTYCSYSCKFKHEINEKVKNGIKIAMANPKTLEKAKKTRRKIYKGKWCSEEGQRNSNIGAWNDEAIKNRKNTYKNHYGTEHPHKNKQYHKEFEDKLETLYGVRNPFQSQEIMKAAKKKYEYEGITFDSSWELAFVIYNLEHNIKFERNKRKFVYVYEGKELNYLPDFIIDGKYIEIKGYSSKQWEAKFNQFPKEETLEVIDKHTIKPYINYVEQKYGKNYITLYENSIYKKDKKKIKIKKELKNIQKHKEAELNGLIRSDGRIDGNGITNKQWLERKNIILNSGVDFSKYGWKSEIKKRTNLTRQEIINTIKHFKEDFDFVFSKK